MASVIISGFSPNFKYTMAKHRGWQAAIIANGESWPRVIGAGLASSSDIYRLGLIPTYSLATISTTVGTSTPAIFGVCIVYRSSKFSDGLSGANIQSNRSNILDIDLTAGSLAVVLTRVASADSKVTAIDIYVSQKIGSSYGTFYRVVRDCANNASTVTFSIVVTNLIPTGVTVTNGTADLAGLVLATDNDYPYAQPIVVEAAGYLISAGGIIKNVTATFTNGSGTVTTVETLYDGIEFWNIRKNSDVSGGIDGRGTYLCRYATANTVTLVNVDGTANTYGGSTTTETGTIWTEPNRRYSSLLNPHKVLGVNNDYPSAVLAAGKVPNTNRVLLMGKDFVIAEDYDNIPIADGLNYVSSEYGCASHFSIVAAHGRLYWLDFSNGRREIIMSDGAHAIPISTAKIKSILQRITLDSNGDAYRVGFIAGGYYKNEDTIRWWLYLDNNTVPNFCLELDLNSGNVANDTQFYSHRYLDVFTYGELRGRPYVGQFGTGSVARIGLDNVNNRYYDWASSGTLSGNLDPAGQTSNVFTVTGAAFATAGAGLVGIQVLIWKEATTSPATTNSLVANPTYYHCRISANTATTLTINYCETMATNGVVSLVDVTLPEVPSGAGWQFAVGVIQAIAGPKWFTTPDDKPKATFKELSLAHKGQALAATSTPIKVHFFENFDDIPLDAQFMEPAVDGTQPSDITISGASFARPTTNPTTVMGFAIVDNNVSTGSTALNMETITLEFDDIPDQGG